MRRRHALELLKAPVEIGNIVEPGLETHVGHRFIAIGQQLAGFTDTQAIDELDEVAPGGLLEHTAEVRRLHAQVLGNFLKRQVAGVVGEDVIHRTVGAIDVVFVRQLRRRRAGQQLVIVGSGEQFQQDKKVPESGYAGGLGNALHQVHRLADGVLAAKLDAVLRPLKQRRQGLEFGEHLIAAVEQLVREVDQHVALGHHFILGHLADPVVGQVGAGEKQCLGIEVADVVADEHLAGTGDDQVQFVFLVEMPAHQRAGETVLAIDDGQPVMVVHQFVGRVGDSGASGHVGTLFLLSRFDHAPSGVGNASYSAAKQDYSGRCRAFIKLAVRQFLTRRLSSKNLH
ncbi:hypothetical protein D3C81_381430 [compost metagenome]